MLSLCLKIALLISTIGFGLPGLAKDDIDTSSSTSLRNLQPNYLSYDRLGLGIKWGTLTGVSAKYWMDDFQAVEITAAFADANTAIGVDYLWNFRGALANLGKFKEVDNFVPFAGAGLLSSFGTSASNSRLFNHDTDSFDLAVRVPIGMEFIPTTVHMGIFAEIGLGFGFIPNSYSFATADIGARYYF